MHPGWLACRVDLSYFPLLTLHMPPLPPLPLLHWHVLCLPTVPTFLSYCTSTTTSVPYTTSGTTLTETDLQCCKFKPLVFKITSQKYFYLISLITESRHSKSWVHEYIILCVCAFFWVHNMIHFNIKKLQKLHIYSKLLPQSPTSLSFILSWPKIPVPYLLRWSSHLLCNSLSSLLYSYNKHHFFLSFCLKDGILPSSQGQ